MTLGQSMLKALEWALEPSEENPLHVGSPAAHNGQKGVICRDRMNGMYDLALDFQGVAPDVTKHTYICGGVLVGLYREELEAL